MTKKELLEWAKTHTADEAPPGFENIGGFLAGSVDPPTLAEELETGGYTSPVGPAVVGKQFTMLRTKLKYEIIEVTDRYVAIRNQNGKVDRWAMPFEWRETDAIDGHVALP